MRNKNWLILKQGVSHGTFEPKINEGIKLREIVCHSVICIIHHYYIRAKNPTAIERTHEKAVPLSDLFIHHRIKIDQLDVTRFIISRFTAQHVSIVSTSIFRSLPLIVDLFHVLYCSGSICVGVTVWFASSGVVSLCRLRH